MDGNVPLNVFTSKNGEYTWGFTYLNVIWNKDKTLGVLLEYPSGPFTLLQLKNWAKLHQHTLIYE